MPRENSEAIKTTITQLAKKAKSYDDKKQFDVSSKLYKKILYLDPTTGKNYQIYAQSLSKANKQLEGYALLNTALLFEPNNLLLINLQIELLFDAHQYQLAKPVIKKAQKIDSNNLNLCIKFAKACHGAKHFADGVQMIQKYEQKDKALVMRSEKLLMWRSYLYYQLGNYTLAQKYASDILKLSNVAEDDIYYYQIQNFKYLILLKNYKDVEMISNKLILDQKVQQKTKLKTYALKAFYFSRVNLPEKALECLQEALKANSNDEMTQCKWSLMTIMVLTNQNLHLLKSNMVEKRLSFVLNKMLLVSQQQFENSRFSEHFNWYQQLRDFERNIEFLLTYFRKIPQFINQFKKYALNMFLTLLQGYQNCIKINERLSQIESSTKIKIEEIQSQSKIQNSPQRIRSQQSQPQK